MASDNRDWYRDWWRKKTGYVERAGFRVSEAEFQRGKRNKALRGWALKLILLALLMWAPLLIRWLR